VRVLETDRLILRWLEEADAPFILELLNDPDWIRFIGDRGVRTLDDARGYIARGPTAMYQRVGFGLYLTELKSERGPVPIGLCGLIKRDTLPDVDIGFAFLPAHRGKGYAHESAAAVMALGKERFGLKRIVAITSEDNDASGKLLEKLGMRLEGRVVLPGDTEQLKLYAWQA
jgi:RimJ/RimL family protein N-acetyltransferase